MAEEDTKRQLTLLELKQKISVPKAAALNDMSPDTFQRTYPHLIKKVSPRRNAVELGDAINLPPKPLLPSRKRKAIGERSAT
jgi:hypothetical protein